MKQKAKIYKGKRIVIGDKNLVTKNEIHVNDIPQEGGESGGGNGGDTPSTPSTSKWTGHADVEGLKAIGWTDDDIAYYQENGVNWNEEDDKYHKVTDDNKALYGVLTADNIQTYRDRIVYLPKIDTSGMTSMNKLFYGCRALISMPQLNTESVTNMGNMFQNCNSLVTIPPINTDSVTDMSYMFNYCYNLASVPLLNTKNVTDMSGMFYYCYSLVSIPPFDTEEVKKTKGMFYYCYSLVSTPMLNTAKVTDISTMFQNCSALNNVIQLDLVALTDTSSIQNIFSSCYSLIHVYIKNIKKSIDFKNSALLSKESLLYLINNKATTSAIKITLHSYAYTRLANDADIVAALAAHPNISISQ
jgi:surface protein